MRNFAKFTRKHLSRKNETLAQVLSCEFLKNTFLQKTTGRLLIVAVSIVVKGELTNETVNYNTKTIVLVQI